MLVTRFSMNLVPNCQWLLLLRLLLRNGGFASMNSSRFSSLDKAEATASLVDITFTLKILAESFEITDL
ncbi:MAG: hypothetical protein CM1200mP39_00490 [Dehalococcoidia bacterium]|nr:MAG: hypothetical protein CM1200mP39_00490 [Dehalococcoidia bacterium]